jgi:alkylation response protein AidB-like acyl-CoA dehydrogenase
MRRSAASRRCCSPTSGWWPARDGDAAPVECGLIKTVTAENAIAAVQDAVALCGNHALSRSNPLERHLRDVLCARVHTPQPDSAHLATDRAALQQTREPEETAP